MLKVMDLPEKLRPPFKRTQEDQFRTISCVKWVFENYPEYPYIRACNLLGVYVQWYLKILGMYKRRKPKHGWRTAESLDKKILSYHRYHARVRNGTNRMLVKYGHLIEGAEHWGKHGKGGGYEIDHLLSIYEGYYKPKVKPISWYKLVHPANLALVPKTENRTKGSRSKVAVSVLEERIAEFELKHGAVMYPWVAPNTKRRLRSKQSRKTTNVKIRKRDIIGLLREGYPKWEHEPRTWLTKETVLAACWHHMNGASWQESAACINSNLTTLAKILSTSKIPLASLRQRSGAAEKLRNFISTPVGKPEIFVISPHGMQHNLGKLNGPLHYLLRGILAGKPISILCKKVQLAEVYGILLVSRSLRIIGTSETKIYKLLIGALHD